MFNREIRWSDSFIKKFREIGEASIRWSDEETRVFKETLFNAMEQRLLSLYPSEGYAEKLMGPWAGTRRIVVQGYKIYYRVNNNNSNIIEVLGLKLPGEK